MVAPIAISPSTGVRHMRAVRCHLVAGQEWHGVAYDQPLHPLGVRLGEREAHRPPVVHEHAHALHFEHVEEALDEARILVDRVLRGSPGLPERPKPGRSGASPPVRSRNGSQSSELLGTPCR